MKPIYEQKIIPTLIGKRKLIKIIRENVRKYLPKVEAGIIARRKSAYFLRYS